MKIKTNKLDWIVWIALAVLAIILIVNFAKINIIGDDVWYHLNVAKQIIDTKSFPLEDIWSFQPTGRPHLYSPLYHLAIAGVAGVGNANLRSLQMAIQLLTAILYPLALFTTWFFARKLIGPKTAFFTFFLMLLDITIANPHFEMTPSSLFLVLMPLILYFFYKKQLIASSLLLIVALYLHLSAPLCLIFVMLIFSLNFKKEYLRFLGKVVLISGIAYIPWIIRILWNLEYFQGYNLTHRLATTGFKGAAFLSAHTISILVVVGAIGAFIFLGYLIRHKKNLFFLIAGPIGFLPILIFAGGRYWWYTMPFFIITFAYLIAKGVKKPMKPYIAVGLILLTFILWLPAITIDFTNEGNVFDWSRSQAGFVKAITIARSQQPAASNDADCQAAGCRLPDDLIDFINANSAEDEIVSATDGKLGMQITYFTDRKTNSGMFGEVLLKEAYEEQLDPWANNLIVCDKGECPTESRCDRAEYELFEFENYDALLKKEEYR